MENPKGPMAEEKRIERADVDKILNLIGACQVAVNHHIPNTWPEKRIVGEKLTEAMTWLKIGHDCQVTVGMSVTPKKVDINGPKD